jgi:hypothetical protein
LRGILFLLFLLNVSLTSCTKDTSTNINDEQIKLKLKANILEGKAPLSIKFTGTLTGKIDTLKLWSNCTVGFCEGGTKTCISYCPPSDDNSFVYAKKKYVKEYTYDSPGHYNPYIYLRIYNKNESIMSDTLSIIVN